MQFTNEQIEKLTANYKQRLMNAQKSMHGEMPTMNDIQQILLKYHLESPDVLEELTQNLGTGYKAGKKNMPSM